MADGPAAEPHWLDALLILLAHGSETASGAELAHRHAEAIRTMNLFADDIIVAVTDCGPGVPPQEREAIFQPYWRAEAVEGIAGTGLGLSVARSAARSLGGDLTVAEGGEGKGARFVLRWPLAT